jgi:hypothetical protein
MSLFGLKTTAGRRRKGNGNICPPSRASGKKLPGKSRIGNRGGRARATLIERPSRGAGLGIGSWRRYANQSLGISTAPNCCSTARPGKKLCQTGIKNLKSQRPITKQLEYSKLMADLMAYQQPTMQLMSREILFLFFCRFYSHSPHRHSAFEVLRVSGGVLLTASWHAPSKTSKTAPR